MKVVELKKTIKKDLDSCDNLKEILIVLNYWTCSCKNMEDKK